MKTKTFTTYQRELKTPVPHAVLIVKACDSDGDIFKVENSELSNDWAYKSHTKCVRGLLRAGYDEVV